MNFQLLIEHERKIKFLNDCAVDIIKFSNHNERRKVLCTLDDDTRFRSQRHTIFEKYTYREREKENFQLKRSFIFAFVVLRFGIESLLPNLKYDKNLNASTSATEESSWRLVCLYVTSCIFYPLTDHCCQLDTCKKKEETHS